MSFAIIVAIIAVIVIVSQNRRISKIEQILAGMTKQPSVLQQTQSSPVSASVATASQVPNIPFSSIPTTKQSPSSLPVINKKANEEFSGRFLGKLGIGAVLIGMAFFLKYAFDNNWIGPSGRVILGIIVGIVLLTVGQYLRKKYLGYSDLLMGGGSAVLYLSIFSAYSFYTLISAPTAGVLMLCVTALTFAVSIVNATITLSLVGIIGAFATPFLVGSSGDNMLTIFVYLTFINLGVLGISFFKKWPKLNVASFIGTVINFSFWYTAHYTPNVLVPTILFCFITFLIFIVVNISRGITTGVKADQADYFLLGANALVFALIAYSILNPQYHAVLGFGAAFVAVIYVAVAFLVNKSNPSDVAINIFLPGLAVTFLSLAVPLQFSGPWIAVAWLIESCVLYGIASIINNRGFQVMGIVVYAIGLLDFFIWNAQHYNDSSFVVLFNTAFVVLVLAVLVSYTIAYVYRRFGSISVDIQNRGIMVFVVIANILTIYALSSQIILYHNAKIDTLNRAYQIETTDVQRYNSGYDTSGIRSNISVKYYDDISSTRNQSNTLVSILWTLYAAILTALGFARRIASLRRLGLILFVITAIKVVIDVWSLGQLYRIISFVVFGLIALIASFGYVKYKDRLKEIV